MNWSPDFCLACDRQTDGGDYCGEACRLAEYEKANSGSEAVSPVSPGRFPTSFPTNHSCLSPAFNFKAHGSGPSPQTSYPPQRPQSSPIVSKPMLTPSSSQSSLFSMQSSTSTTSSSTEAAYMTDEAQRELRAYATCFDQSRYQRRQSA